MLNAFVSRNIEKVVEMIIKIPKLIKDFFKVNFETTPDQNNFKFVLFYKFVWWVMIFVIGIVLGFIANNMLVESAKTFSLDATFMPLDKNEKGFYYPVKIFNVGDKDIRNADLEITTCQTQYPFRESIQVFPNKQDITYNFRDGRTELLASKRTCSQGPAPDDYNCEIQILKFKDSNKLYVPKQTCQTYLCQPCNYRISINSNEFSKIINGSLYFPYMLSTLEINPDQEAINESLLENFEKIGLNIFSATELCVWDGNCTLSQAVQMIDYNIPDQKFILTLSPKKFTALNVSLFYRLDINELKKVLSQNLDNN